jgi:hypothetical protein
MANLGWKYFFLLGSHLSSLWIITSLSKIQHQSNIYSIEITFYVLIANSKFNELKKLKTYFPYALSLLKNMKVSKVVTTWVEISL